jgi:hypothetical protein
VAVGEIGARIAAGRIHPAGRVERVTHELGAFATGRIDGSRFAAILATGATLDPGLIGRLEQAHERLQTIAERGDEQFVVRVHVGGDVRSGVARALGEIGRAFAAARDAGVAGNGRSSSGAPDEDAGGFPFRRWNRAERQIAPPLIIDVNGGDAQAIALAEFLDGRQKLVMILRGPAPAAPLARLATPGVFVMQTREVAELAELVAVDGPAIAALVPEGCAEFVHRPANAESGGSFEVRHIPTEAAKNAIGSFGVLQQAEDLAYLKAAIGARAAELVVMAAGASMPGTAEPPSVTGDAIPGAAGAGSVAVPSSASPLPPPQFAPLATATLATPVSDPADRLAAWLLRQADLNGAG